MQWIVRKMIAAAACAMVVLMVAVSCGGGSDSSPTSPTPPTSGGGTPVETNTITISSAGVVSPMAIRVALGSTVTMVNNDSRSHDMNSDPHPAHTDCPAIDWGLLQPGQNRQSGALTIARTCGYHDHSQPTNTSLQGTIQVQ